MRNGLVAFAAAHGAGEGPQADIALAVSEGLTNAVLHAFTARPPGMMGLIARAALDVLHVRVIDDGRGMGPRRDSPGLGVGMTVIVRLSSTFEVKQGPTGRGTEVRLTFDVPGLRETRLDRGNV